ncbi:MAG TPA: crotonase/enoyl-CoA hydratase family protein [Candidatus Dormibacteraeota bacterium]|nr:crotonase/enoyl-CoA hydratase family protein [Candidatus Dormibacteraeota bacterium]
MTTADTSTAPVLAERRDGVLVITLNRPQARNAVDAAVAQGVQAALDELDADGDLRVGIVTGAGGYFCAGMDLKAFVRGESPRTERGFAGICQRPADKPLIAAVEGFALAGGLEIALSCDLLVAARGARLGIPEVKRGLAAAAGGLLRLPKRIPYHVAMQMALTGEPITAERAYEVGLVVELSDPGAALDTALRLGAVIAANGPLAVRVSKQIVRSAVDWAEPDAWQRQAEVVAPVFTSEDAREGAVAFAEKRPPVWKGR